MRCGKQIEKTDQISNLQVGTGAEDAVKTRLILKSGQPGTKTLAKKYGDALLCVRFRYDAASRQRLKTVELVVERTDWTPPPPRYGADTLVPLRIDAFDMQSRSQVKTVGGRWDPEKKLWFVKYGKISGTSLEKHIQVDDS
jgi:hypothetical protein